jgi:predicted XRE-type DNA-binding protein
MPNTAESKPTHVTTGNVFAELGFSPEKALALKFKARILAAILHEVKCNRYRQSQLVTILHEHQPVISNLLRGKIAHMSIEKLLIYAERLGLSLDVRRPRRSSRRVKAAWQKSAEEVFYSLHRGHHRKLPQDAIFFRHEKPISWRRAAR